MHTRRPPPYDLSGTRPGPLPPVPSSRERHAGGGKTTVMIPGAEMKIGRIGKGSCNLFVVCFHTFVYTDSRRAYRHPQKHRNNKPRRLADTDGRIQAYIPLE